MKRMMKILQNPKIYFFTLGILPAIAFMLFLRISEDGMFPFIAIYFFSMGYIPYSILKINASFPFKFISFKALFWLPYAVFCIAWIASMLFIALAFVWDYYSEDGPYIIASLVAMLSFGLATYTFSALIKSNRKQ